MIFIASVALSAACMAWAPPDRPVRENELPEEAVTILTKATELELLSLDPNRPRGPVPPKGESDSKDQPESKDKTELFHGFRILGKTLVKDAGERKNVVEAFLAGTKGDIEAYRCFNPRHGIRAVYAGKTIELAICFSCSQFHLHGVSDWYFYYVNDKPRPVFDKVLTAAGIEIAK